ncbi:pyruvate kinase [Trinickia caryophylli]|uniref:Pyruvate kinase n=1 Tax=Trinickia caryophylli TaxID=28094 RepID=A0A1X7FPP3_TRICW|nr:pyruvate kinase [Trinickia caryophylli]TRX14373.1 pyruvate kinase [Trinickia caryophylli]WQE14207.1 pyruvate kinase [Trinickia caryophylli]GLU33285.1 pyruvate kinase [Trinickia caryophylli]SMF55632.1 pyruvate kinase [Trinickia caryophylli]
MKRERHAKIVATLGPSSSDPQTIRRLFDAGVDVFRLNFSHGSHDDHLQRLRHIREIEKETGRPIGVLLDLQGPKLRLGTFESGSVVLSRGQRFLLDTDLTPGDASRAPLPHPEIFAAIEPGSELLLDDGKVRLRVVSKGPDRAETTVIVGGRVSDRKGVNVPGVMLPISAMTGKDREDLAFGLEQGVDWVALSFVQRPEDIDEARAIIGDRAWIMAKLEKPRAIDHLDAIAARCDGIMVARGDLGVELPAEQIPELQRRIVRVCRAAGKTVVVATQMLESMTESPVPTRAETSDVAGAIYEGTDAVMLSAESASGKYPLEAVSMMNRIIARVELDPEYRAGIDASHTPAQSTAADAICCALRTVVQLIAPAVTVTCTSSGFTTVRAARERAPSAIMALTPSLAVARRLALVWGTHPIALRTAHDVDDMIALACDTARHEGFANTGDSIVIAAGLPFGESGTTNLLHIAKVGT